MVGTGLQARQAQSYSTDVPITRDAIVHAALNTRVGLVAPFQVGMKVQSVALCILLLVVIAERISQEHGSKIAVDSTFTTCTTTTTYLVIIATVQWQMYGT